jgi:hypothetical protein
LTVPSARWAIAGAVPASSAPATTQVSMRIDTILLGPY